MFSGNLIIEYWRIADLVPYARNPRKNDKAVKRMMAAVREFGFRVPLLILRNGEVIDGDLRLKAARALEMTEVPAIVCDDWSGGDMSVHCLIDPDTV